jgi:hypothetical protein
MNFNPAIEGTLISEEWTPTRLKAMLTRDLYEDYRSLEWELMHWDGVVRDTEPDEFDARGKIKPPSPDYIHASGQAAVIRRILSRIGAVLAERGIEVDVN